MFFWNVIIKLICNWFCLADELQRASLGPRAPSILTVSKARDRGPATTAPAPARSSCSNGNFLREDRIIFFLFLGIEYGEGELVSVYVVSVLVSLVCEGTL